MWLAPERRGRQGWLVPVFAMLAGVGVATFLVYREEMTAGLIAGGVLLAYGVQLAYRRDERGLAVSESFGRGRRGGAHLRAAAMTGDVLVAGLVAAVVVQALRGADLGPLPYLAGVAALTYLISIVIAADF
ncbi:ABC transporter permease [Actinocorallia sp. A-T 12471]|uniref:ABC transporter permease n=1 Tax=Actinocorallia sp. A-T 12471 TaxID=3089813 RepID=UPI0029CEBB59|nr:ABC transporter permease [Actinocorallia sp. A-T 12471]MDX6740526.1 ABC transporter permease [Actinocorallia sp. A-T 12471]